MASFDPTLFDFVRLRDFLIGGSVPVFEYRNHPAIDGGKNFLRLNVYLSRDGEYVTVWRGLLEPMFTEAELTEGQLALVDKPDDLSAFLRSYNETLFRGYIDSDDTAEHILQALRIQSSSQYPLPQELRRGSDNKLSCDKLE